MAQKFPFYTDHFLSGVGGSV